MKFCVIFSYFLNKTVLTNTILDNNKAIVPDFISAEETKIKSPYLSIFIRFMCVFDRDNAPKQRIMIHVSFNIAFLCQSSINNNEAFCAFLRPK